MEVETAGQNDLRTLQLGKSRDILEKWKIIFDILSPTKPSSLLLLSIYPFFYHKQQVKESLQNVPYTV